MWLAAADTKVWGPSAGLLGGRPNGMADERKRRGAPSGTRPQTSQQQQRQAPDARGILKPVGSFERRQSHQSLKFDEMNVLQTLHPPGKDYGHMKIDEAKTPYSYDIADDRPAVDPALLAERIQMGSTVPAKALKTPDPSQDTDKDMEERNRQFELRRKLHYNEGNALKRGSQRVEDDDEDDDD
ncbi:protein phosphatase inhibitor 2 isoform X1 [Ixodes scapularis]|uniref:protein phosphatase inhibitor 2 isoform X1 n=1 Tax=Ixodes scapularis TaxID=6945 RepID=UPI001161AA5F|nr:protein phosphatase inhibitor 2 isoform X1 [Ixodes scapularis]